MGTIYNYGFSQKQILLYKQSCEFIMNNINFDELVKTTELTQSKLAYLLIEILSQIQTRTIPIYRRIALKGLQRKVYRMQTELSAIRRCLSNNVRQTIYGDFKTIQSWFNAIQMCLQCNKKIREIQRFIATCENKI
jgi:hypothetical protein